MSNKIKLEYIFGWSFTKVVLSKQESSGLSCRVWLVPLYQRENSGLFVALQQAQNDDWHWETLDPVTQNSDRLRSDRLCSFSPEKTSNWHWLGWKEHPGGNLSGTSLYHSAGDGFFKRLDMISDLKMDHVKVPNIATCSMRHKSIVTLHHSCNKDQQQAHGRKAVFTGQELTWMSLETTD